MVLRTVQSLEGKISNGSLPWGIASNRSAGPTYSSTAPACTSTSSMTGSEVVVDGGYTAV